MTRVLAPGCRLGLLLFRVQNPSSLALCRDRFGIDIARQLKRKGTGPFLNLGASPQTPAIFEGMGVYRPMSRKAEREAQAARSTLIVSMSPLGYSLARLLRSRAGLRFTQPIQFTPPPEPASLQLSRLTEYKHNFSCTPNTVRRDAKINEQKITLNSV